MILTLKCDKCGNEATASDERGDFCDKQIGAGTAERCDGRFEADDFNLTEQTATDIKALTPIQAISFLRSVIRSGEQLTDNDEKVIDGAINQHATLLTENAQLKAKLEKAEKVIDVYGNEAKCT